MAEIVPPMDCGICVAIAQYLSEHGEVSTQELNGFMLTRGTTTAIYHLEKHLCAQGLVDVKPKGRFRKKRYARLTNNGKKALQNTPKKE